MPFLVWFPVFDFSFSFAVIPYRNRSEIMQNRLATKSVLNRIRIYCLSAFFYFLFFFVVSAFCFLPSHFLSLALDRQTIVLYFILGVFLVCCPFSLLFSIIPSVFTRNLYALFIYPFNNY